MSTESTNSKKFRISDIIGYFKMDTSTARINTLINIGALVSLVGLIATKGSMWLLLLVIFLMGMYWNYTKITDESIENYKSIVKIDPNNPVKNILHQNDVDIESDNTPIQNLNQDRALQDKIKESLDHNLYRDESDIFDNCHSQRSFYTMPVTTIPNKQTEFANWLYKMPKTCKEGNGARCKGLIYTPGMIMGTGTTATDSIIKKKTMSI